MKDKDLNKEQNKPDEAYRQELDRKGTTFNDSPVESDARDDAKMVRTSHPDSQKIDGNNPFAEEDTVSDEEIHKETYDDHK
ncbi:MAG: hypothetical protein EON98_05465 [Chitinophagaceae bacterium]|nr:MAG: hypothetical protein EON98_05465 [Chitinophagaceae bacterium]